MDLFTPDIKKKIQRNIVGNATKERYDLAAKHISKTIAALHAAIPPKKRISYGIYFTVKSLGMDLHDRLMAADTDEFTAAKGIFEYGEDDEKFFKSKGVSLKVLSLWALGKDHDYKLVLPFFEGAASSAYWDLREYAAGFFRVIIRKHPEPVRRYLKRRARAKDTNTRRWVAETLRPVRENGWFNKQSEYSLSILEHLFAEKAAYARTSVGNNLSDLARRQPERVYELVQQLVASGDANSYWIATRACRNLVKKEPIRVMDLLQTDEYRYKGRVHRRSES